MLSCSCGAMLSSESVICSNCGTHRGVGITLKPDRAALQFQTFTPSLVWANGPSPSGVMSIKVEAPGVSSRTLLTSDNCSLHITGAEGIGTQVESRVRKTLLRKLELLGLVARMIPGKDERGEDAILRMADRRIDVQIVTVPAECEFWHEASLGPTSREVDILGALQWLHAAIEKKARRIAPSHRADVLIAIDANHAGVLGTKLIVDEYTGRFGSPDARYGFHSVWVVGPTIDHCARLERDASPQMWNPQNTAR
jgi:hypothetical protein